MKLSAHPFDPEPGRIHLDLSAQPDFRHKHRFGWPFALDALAPLHHPQGVWLDSFVDQTFVLHEERELLKGTIPYRRPWIGFLHHPPHIPEWNDPAHAPEGILRKASFQESLPTCRGLFVLSDYLKTWYEARLSVPIVALKHPSGSPLHSFTMERFCNNPAPRLVHLGCWQRRLRSIYEVPVKTLRKTLVVHRTPRYPITVEREQRMFGPFPQPERVDILPYLPASQYDAFLAENIVFIHLYDSSVNNTILESIARHTPILVNRLPAVVEYLGPDYPFYFETLEEAGTKAESLQAISAAHAYLVDLPKSWLSGDAFRDAFVRSRIYQSLPNPRDLRRQESGEP